MKRLLSVFLIILHSGICYAEDQAWNLHFQNTDIVQADPTFSAEYSGQNSLHHTGEMKETISADLYSGLQLWNGAEAHLDGLAWQGFGLSNTLGAAGFPNGEAFRLGTHEPKATIARLFVRQVIGFGGDTEEVKNDQLNLQKRVDISRLTVSIGKVSAKDFFDNNRYANDPRTQFMNWSLMANEGWDYPADALGFIPGIVGELNQKMWALRYGIFQEPKHSNGMLRDQHYVRAWGMATELERRFSIGDRSGTARMLSYLNRARMGSYSNAVNNPSLKDDITQTRQYRLKYGAALNIEQELTESLGFFSRAGWSDGRSEAWAFSDTDSSISGGLSMKGVSWGRADDIAGVAGVLNGISAVHRRFLEAGGIGILVGDGALSYGMEEILETYYDALLWRELRGALDYQLLNHPAFNRDRGPVSIFSVRLHLEL